MPAVLLLPTGKALTVRTAADAFLDSLANPNTVRASSDVCGACSCDEECDEVCRTYRHWDQSRRY